MTRGMFIEGPRTGAGNFWDAWMRGTGTGPRVLRSPERGVPGGRFPWLLPAAISAGSPAESGNAAATRGSAKPQERRRSYPDRSYDSRRWQTARRPEMRLAPVALGDQVEEMSQMHGLPQPEATSGVQERRRMPAPATR